MLIGIFNYFNRKEGSVFTFIHKYIRLSNFEKFKNCFVQIIVWLLQNKFLPIKYVYNYI